MATAKAHSTHDKRHSNRAAQANGSAASARILTLDEAAEFLRVPREEVLIMVDAQNLPGRKFGTEWRFLQSALLDWLARPTGKSALLGELGRIKDDPHAEELLRQVYKRRSRAALADG